MKSLTHLRPTRKKPLGILFGLLSSFLLLQIWWSSNHTQTLQLLQWSPLSTSTKSRPVKCPSTCPMKADYLSQNRHNLTEDIIFHRQCIHARGQRHVDRDHVPELSDLLFDRGQLINLDDSCQTWEDISCNPISLDVPLPFPDKRYPQLIFGVATSFDRLTDSLPQFSHWLSGSGSKLVAIVTDDSEHAQDLPALVSRFNDEDVDLVIGTSWDGVGVNEQHFTVLRDILEHASSETKWIGIIDDDTFFPALFPLSNALSTQDHTVPAYLGGLSDNLWALKIHGVMAYGGAGAFLSVPLAEQLDPLIELCLDEKTTEQGDALLRDCIYNRTNTKLTQLPGLNQLDIMGNPDGFYESGRLPLSLHHWKSWHHAPVDMIAKASDFCGDCLLQRWRLGSDTVITNGYSIAVYDGGIDQHALSRTEGTFDYTDLFDWSLGPIRQKSEEGRKRSYRLIEAEMIGGSLRQVYVYRTSRDKKTEKRSSGAEGRSQDIDYPMDEVVELWWDWW